MGRTSGRVLSMAGAAFFSATALQCGGRLPVGEVESSGNALGSAGGSTGAATVTSGTGTGSSAGAAGADDSPATTSPSDGPACWENQLPPEAQPILPTATVTASCAAASTITQWNALDPLVGDSGAAEDTDARAAIVGRWLACSPGDTAFSSLPYAGIEFGGNGRWRLLVTDSSGALVPTTSTGTGAQGRYYALGSGELILRDNGFAYGDYYSIKLSADGNTLEVPAPANSFYARTTPAANNGDDNLPSTTDGTCSMVGMWDLAMTSESPAGTFSFDELGNFVGGPPGADLCTSHTMYGTYALSPGLFQITENIGLGICPFFDDAAYPATFDATCTHVALQQSFDNCTGGRRYFNGATTLTKHQ